MDSQNFSQRTSSSVRERLPPFCSLSLEDSDEETLDELLSVESDYFTPLAGRVRGVFADFGLEDEEDVNPEAEADDSDVAGNVREQEDSPVEDADSEDGRPEVEFEWRAEDEDFFAAVQKFRKEGCGCNILSTNPCVRVLGMDVLETARMKMAELSHTELDLVILSHLQQNRCKSVLTKKTASHTKQQARHRADVKYFFQGHPVCQRTFLFAHNISLKRYKTLCQHFDEHGLTPRVHGNTGKRPTRAFGPDTEKHALDFIEHYAAVHAMPMPGRMPNIKDYSVMMLPSDVTKIGLWEQYKQACEASNEVYVGLTKFKDLWSQYLPKIAIMKIASDLCDVCQQNNHLIMQSMNMDESEKNVRLKRQERHLADAKLCRECYRSQCTECEDVLGDMSVEQRAELRSPRAENVEMIDGPVHYSFDYAQNLLYPLSPQKGSSVYFKTLRKVHIFGVCCEALPQQINYLVDEADFTGKGANETISYLHHYLSIHAIPSRRVKLHCDNCVGQNKNKYVLYYLVWRVLQNFHLEVELSFMLVGHTRFGPDWCFGLTKNKYRKAYVHCLQDVGAVVNTSTKKDINVAQHVRDPDSGNLLVPVYDWKQYFRDFKAISQITKYQNFRVSASHPGIVFVRTMPDSPESPVVLFEGNAIPTDLPTRIEPKGLTAQRQWYLYNQVRQYAPDESPKPTVPKP